MLMLKEIANSSVCDAMYTNNKKYLRYINMPRDPRPQRPVINDSDQLGKFLGQNPQTVSHKSQARAIAQGHRPPTQSTPTPTPINHEN